MTPHSTPTQTDSPVRQIDHLLAHYGESHTHPTNELIHYVAVPLIVFSLVDLANRRVRLGRVGMGCHRRFL